MRLVDVMRHASNENRASSSDELYGFMTPQAIEAPRVRRRIFLASAAVKASHSVKLRHSIRLCYRLLQTRI